MCNDCSICYEKDPKCRLVCGHTFHHECIKTWYMKGTNVSCPMCRNNICFRGMFKKREKWENERREQQFADIYREVIMNTLNDFKDMGYNGQFIQYTLEDIEKDYLKLKCIIDDPDDMKYLLYNPLDMPIAYKGPPIYYERTIKNKPPKKIKQHRMRNYRR